MAVGATYTDAGRHSALTSVPGSIPHAAHLLLASKYMRADDESPSAVGYIDFGTTDRIVEISANFNVVCALTEKGNAKVSILQPT